MSHSMLDQGSIQRMVGNDTSITPRLQVLDVKKIVTGQSGERFRLVLSDGQYYIQGMLATQCTELVNNGQLKKYAIIHLKEFVCNNISGKKICVVIQCDVIQQLNQGIGKPQNALTANSGSSISPNRNNSNQNQNQPQQQQQNNRPAPPQNQQPFHQRNNNNYNNSNRNQGGNGGQGGGQGQGMDNIQPVSSLNPYQNSWKIRVRCTMKDNMRHYSNQKGDGKFFGVDLLDRNGTEIRAVAFNEAADKFYSIFEKNNVYLISKGQVRLARKGYSHIKNDYSITLNQDAIVIPVNDNANCNDIEQQKYRFIKIDQISQIEPKSFVDVIGVVVDVGDITQIMSNRTQNQMKKRNLKIADQTAKIDVTLWNKDAEQWTEDQLKNAIIALKGCKVSGYGGRSLSASGFIDIHPDREETRSLISWLQNNHNGDANNINVTELTTGGGGVNVNAPRRTFAEVKEMNLGTKVTSKTDKREADYFTVVATITTIAQSADRKPWYEANPDLNSDAKNCKVTSMGDGKWRCEKNGKVYNGYIPRYILRFCATDFTGNIWLTAYDESAQKILKKTAKESETLFINDRPKYEQIFKEAQFKKYVFKCRAWSDVWEDSQRVRYDVLGVQIADPQQESEKLIEKIQFLQNLKNSSN